eukprot:TRINITY_DN6542_c0_g2_i7.p2 TRINITY_DN6542_c0_g2~~TRINITY_DN6542_c0_g2_i7.p2  ORF type:complete len:222 (+),score=51.74 TRINITY_DN6542_c0_g2_i7:1318-1983(+)
MCDDKRCFSIQLENTHPDDLTVEILGIEVRLPVDCGFIPTHQFKLPEFVETGEVHAFLITFLPNPGKEDAQSSPRGSEDVPFTVTWRSSVCREAVQIHQVLNWRYGSDEPVTMKLNYSSPVPLHQSFQVTATISNHALKAGNFKVLVPDKLEGLLCLEKIVTFGSISAGESKSVALHFLAIQEGMVELKDFEVLCEASKFRMLRSAFLYATVSDELVAPTQ